MFAEALVAAGAFDEKEGLAVVADLEEEAPN